METGLPRPTITCKDDDDEWYDRSITYYKELIMLETENQPLQMSIGEHDHVFLLEQKAPKKQVLSLQKLPEKIVEARKDDIVKTSHLRIVAGTLVDVEILQMQAVFGKGTLIASEVGCPGLRIYKHKSDTDKLEKDSKRLAPGSLTAPNFALMDDESLILTKTVQHAAFSFDMARNSSHRLKLDAFSSYPTDTKLISFPISSHSVALGLEDTGFTAIYDLRSHSIVATINDNNKLPSKWCFASAYRPTPPFAESNVVAMTTDGFTAVFDLRAPSKPAVTGATPRCPGTTGLSPSGAVLSVSDDAGLVNLFTFSRNGFAKAFCHEGHVRMEHCDRNANITDHRWYSDATIISSADNKTVNIWQFNIPAN